VRALLIIALCFAVAPFLKARMTSPETYADFWPNGTAKSIRETIRDADGDIVDHGWYRLFHANGQPDEEGRLDRGVRVGQWTWYYDSGARRGECFYQDGVGDYTAFFESGAVLRKGRQRGVKREGTWTEWYESGARRMEGPYVDDLQHGCWTYWEDGNPTPMLTIDWINGERQP